MTPGFADQISAHPDVADVICSDWNHIGLGCEARAPGCEAGEPGGEAGAPVFGVAEAQPTDKSRITAAVHHAPTVARRVIAAPLSGPLTVA
jgi:hypothetical protein